MQDERPVLVTVICILGFLGVPLTFLLSILTLVPEFAALTGQVFPIWYSVFSIVLAVLYLVGLIFIWKMKKWALVCYTTLVIADYIAMFSIGIASYLMLATISSYLLPPGLFTGGFRQAMTSPRQSLGPLGP